MLTHYRGSLLCEFLIKDEFSFPDCDKNFKYIDDWNNENHNVCGIEILLGGDTELITFIETLESAAKILKKMINKEKNKT
jgi:hypothetical protein